MACLTFALSKEQERSKQQLDKFQLDKLLFAHS